jgi:hypothetical protein
VARNRTSDFRRRRSSRMTPRPPSRPLAANHRTSSTSSASRDPCAARNVRQGIAERLAVGAPKQPEPSPKSARRRSAGHGSRDGGGVRYGVPPDPSLSLTNAWDTRVPRRALAGAGSPAPSMGDRERFARRIGVGRSVPRRPVRSSARPHNDGRGRGRRQWWPG